MAIFKTHFPQTSSDGSLPHSDVPNVTEALCYVQLIESF
jgi:hypothetical protein